MMCKFKNALITTVLMIFSSNIVFAENYIMMSNESILSVDCSNCGVVAVKPLTTIMNDKKTIIITPIKDGTAEFKVKLKNRTLTYKAVVKDGKIDFTGNRVIKIVPLDLPPEFIPQGNSCNKGDGC